ncbi:MAG: CDP-2,3-bis-(O-geranylgeranyl)-sn-glycerol synthase [Acidilobaceae archaeon]
MALDYKVVDSVIEGLIVILPAMVANATPVLSKGKIPIDFNKKFIDGRRLLGDGKTWEGLIVGLTAGTITGLILALIMRESILIEIGILASLGAMIGDIIASFIKRRLRLERGEPAPILDQLNFYIGAVIVLYIAGYRFTLAILLILAIISGLLHILANIVAYKLKLKRVPW